MEITKLAIKEANNDFLYIGIDPHVTHAPSTLINTLLSCEAVPLFKNTQLESYLHKSPYLIQMNNSPILPPALADVNGINAAVFFISQLGLKELAHYIQKIILQKRYDDNFLLLRLYDPFTLDSFRVMLSNEERKVFFQNIKKVIYTSASRRVRILQKRENTND